MPARPGCHAEPMYSRSISGRTIMTQVRTCGVLARINLSIPGSKVLSQGCNRVDEFAASGTDRKHD
jgi:hypothetical protein